MVPLSLTHELDHIGPSRNQEKRFHFGKADWDGLRTAASKLSEKLLKMYESAHDTESLWTAFKADLLAATNQHIPSTSSTPRHHLPWVNHHLKKLLKKKKNAYTNRQQEHKTGPATTNPESMQASLSQSRMETLRNTIEVGLSNNNPKPFWRYIKVKKQDNSGAEPLKYKGSLSCDAKTEAEILVNQFRTGFTTTMTDPLPKLPQYNQISHLHINEDGVVSLLKNISSSKAAGPDPIVYLKNVQLN